MTTKKQLKKIRRANACKKNRNNERSTRRRIKALEKTEEEHDFNCNNEINLT